MKKYFILALFMIYAAGVSCQTIFNLKNDGTILKDNQPFFPMGFYIERGTIDSYKAMVDSLSAAGSFNLINVPYPGGDFDSWNSLMDLCASKNIYVINQLFYDNTFLEPVNLFKTHPAIYG